VPADEVGGAFEFEVRFAQRWFDGVQAQLQVAEKLHCILVFAEYCTGFTHTL